MFYTKQIEQVGSRKIYLPESFPGTNTVVLNHPLQWLRVSPLIQIKIGFITTIDNNGYSQYHSILDW